MATIIERSRFAFDIGTNSIGWAVYRLDQEHRPCDLIACGVRLFSDGRNPKDGQSLAAMRRIPRAARRRRDRFLQRRGWLMQLLVRHGLMPATLPQRKALERLDPYVLRARAVEERVDAQEIGRALFHLNQRRGYRSNRIADAGADDRGKIAEAGERLQGVLNGRTLGQYYSELQQGPVRQRKGVRARLNGQGAKAFYEVYPQRWMLEDEFDRIWATQAPHHSEIMTDTAREAIRSAMFHQRPLKPPVVGRCTFFPEETRLPQAHPLAQRFQIYQELANLELVEGNGRPRRLSIEDRDRLAEPLLAGEDLSFGRVRRLLEIGGRARINLEEGGRDKLKGDLSAARLGGKKGALARLWPQFTESERAEVIERLLQDEEAPLTSWLTSELSATEEEASAATAFRPPEGHIRLGLTAARGVVEKLKEGEAGSDLVIRYHEALKLAFPDLHHSDLRNGEIFDRLPDYREVLERHTIGGTGNPADSADKRWGRISNPTVHIGLNQLRRVMNALIDIYGPPSEVVLELARELKQNKEQRDRLQRDNKKNEEANRRRGADLDASGYPATPQNLRLYRLWEDLGSLPRICTYTGRTMSFDDVFSDRVEIEHILPFSRTLDDTMANKTLAFREANRGKRNLAPEEAFSGDDYEAVKQRAQSLPPNKNWRFLPGAMDRYQSEERDFLARQLNETRHLSRLAKEYVGKVCDPNAVWVVTGQLTALLRARWGLNFSNAKDRNNHRHHAIDAATIGVIDRGLLNEIARRAGRREEDDQRDEIVKDVPPPPGFVAAGRDFRTDVQQKVQALIVSNKPEHGISGALHEDTAYGFVASERGEDGNLVFRKPIDGLTSREVGRIRDLDLRARLTAWLYERQVKESDRTAWAATLREFGQATNVRRVRLLKQEDGAIVIRDRRTGAPYKALIGGDNAFMDIVEGADGVWRGLAVGRFEANRKDVSPVWSTDPEARLVMRLFKGDLVELEDVDGLRRVKRVVRLEPSAKRIRLAAHDEAGELQKRHEDRDDPFQWDFAYVDRLQARRCKPVYLDALGRGRHGPTET